MSRIRTFQKLCLVAILAAATTAHGDALSDRSELSLDRFLELYVEHHDVLPVGLTDEERTDLVNGEPLVRLLNQKDSRDHGKDNSMGVLGITVVEAPRLLVWLSLVRDSEELDGRVTRAILAQWEDGTRIRYQHINLPWPFRDRHWVIEVGNSRPIVDASNGAVWERRWGLHDGGRELIDDAFDEGTITGLTRKRIDKSIYLPHNSGSWSVGRLTENRTLVAVYVNAELGGNIPRGLVRRLARRNLKSGLDSLGSLVEETLENIDRMKLPVDGLGTQITISDVEDIRRNWKTDAKPSR